MIDPVAIQLQESARGRGLYESFYFRGTTSDGGAAFWLKHNLLRRPGGKKVLVEATMVTSDRRTGKTACVYEREEVPAASFARLARNGQWEAAAFNFSSGSFFQISRERLKGKLHTASGSAAWDLALTRSDEVLFHFPHERYYTLPLPSKKLLTRDCRLGFEGRVSCAGMVLAGSFLGMNGHNWGSAHAHEYAYANCNGFREDSEAYFDGFTARLGLLGGWLKTPYLSMASLKTGGRWYHFNRLLDAPRQPIDALDNYRWLLGFSNETHRLEVAIDGANPRVEPWVALNYEHPDGRRSVVKNTKFAAGRLRLFEKDAPTALCELNSEFFELETLLPDNVPGNLGYVGLP